MVNWQSYIDFIVNKGDIEDCIILSSNDAHTWASTPNFNLREYLGLVVKEDGAEVEELINEADNLLKLMNGSEKPLQGLRLNGGKKQQLIREFKDPDTNNFMVYGKLAKGGSCIANAGKCILVGTFNENKGHTSSGCNEVITLMAKHLIKAPWPEDNATTNSDSSWQSYVDLLLIGKGNVSDALICSSETGLIWASSPNFTLKTYEALIMDEEGNEHNEIVDEAKNLIDFMATAVRPKQGLRLNQDKKYQIVKAAQDDDMSSYIINGKKVKGGCWIAKSGSAIIVTVFDETKEHTSSGCSTTLANVIKYLNSIK